MSRAKSLATAAAVIILLKRREKCLKKKRKMWFRKWIARREEKGACGKLLRKLKCGDEIFDKKFVLIPLLLFPLKFCSC
jgi:hypothetical protein